MSLEAQRVLCRLYIYIYICTHTYIYMYTHIYTYTHIHRISRSTCPWRRNARCCQQIATRCEISQKSQFAMSNDCRAHLWEISCEVLSTDRNKVWNFSKAKCNTQFALSNDSRAHLWEISIGVGQCSTSRGRNVFQTPFWRTVATAFGAGVCVREKCVCVCVCVSLSLSFFFSLSLSFFLALAVCVCVRVCVCVCFQTLCYMEVD